MSDVKVLYQKGSYGLKEWCIWSEANVIHISANGARYTEVITEGKAGRSIKDQVALRVNARIRSKLDGGFKETKEEAGNFTNQLGLPMPMLAKKIQDVRGVNLENCFIQNKLDGHRCLVTRQGNELVAYSRRGKVINTIGHILSGIDIPEGLVLDGEMYVHGQRLQTIASWAKRLQPNTKKLQYQVYDCFIPGEPLSYNQRKQVLSDIGLCNPCQLVETYKYDPNVKLGVYFSKAKADGYEGLILRPQDGVYGIGKRTSDLIKVKKREDAEFGIIDIVPSREGLGILVLSLGNGKTFKTLAPGTNMVKNQMLKSKENYIGKMVTCEFAERTKDGVPFHCVAIRIREDV